MLIIGSLFLNGCSKDDSTVVPCRQIDDINTSTRAEPGSHWRCSECGFLNGPWRCKCLLCANEYSTEFGGLPNALRSIVTAIRTLPAGGYISEEKINNRVELPNDLVMEFPPENWFDAPKALKYYDALKTFQYSTDKAYAEAVNYGWYHTVRMLYPKYTNLFQAQMKYNAFLVNEGRLLRGVKGSGLKNGSKAAIDAFANR